jgi:hypothetical protein
MQLNDMAEAMAFLREVRLRPLMRVPKPIPQAGKSKMLRT